MQRESILRLLKAGLAGSAFSLVPGSCLWGATGPDYRGQLFVMVEAGGGWDATSFCDPKMNVPGEDKINHWADSDETRDAWNIRYAPFAGNEAFFEKYYRHMLVINGIDAQTNAHSAGVIHNWSGWLDGPMKATTPWLSTQIVFKSTNRVAP